MLLVDEGRHELLVYCEYAELRPHRSVEELHHTHTELKCTPIENAVPAVIWCQSVSKGRDVPSSNSNKRDATTPAPTAVRTEMAGGAGVSTPPGLTCRDHHHP